MHIIEFSLTKFRFQEKRSINRQAEAHTVHSNEALLLRWETLTRSNSASIRCLVILFITYRSNWRNWIWIEREKATEKKGWRGRKNKGQARGRTKGYVSNRMPRAKDEGCEERPVQIIETKIEERVALSHGIDRISTSERSSNTLDARIPISHFSHFTRSNSTNSRSSPHSSPLLPYLARHRFWNSNVGIIRLRIPGYIEYHRY